MGIFSNNGIGKTFISRGFRLTSLINENPEDTNTDYILTNNQNNGSFNFKITEGSTSKKLEIKLERNSKPNVINDTGYFFHVFNSDYVNDNLWEYDYKPSGERIQGYILGKEFIDVSNEKLRLEELKTKQNKVHHKIENAIKNGFKELDALKINKNIREYKLITFYNVIGNLEINEVDSFESIVKDRERLESMPDDVTDIQSIYVNIDKSSLVTVQDVLSKKYHKSELDHVFVEKIKSNQTFIEDGIHLIDNNKNECPFCHQNLEKKAIDLISSYHDYLKDSEAQAVKAINGTIKKLENLKLSIESKYHDFIIIKNNFNEIKQFFPSFKKKELNYLDDNQMVFYHIDELIKMLNLKKENITYITFDFQSHILEIDSFLKNLKINFEEANDKIKDLNEIKNSSGKEKLQLNRRICTKKYLDIKNQQGTNIQQKLALDLEISQIEKEITIKENKSKIDRKKKVVESLQHFLNFFFNGKYNFDEENFCITFNDELLSDNVSYFLSDGEKGIVAFCYYLATVHTIIEKQEDYKKLFFVIDDPISSMDFTFVHKVANCINDINVHFEPESFNRFVILTHSIEFMNLLMSNRLITQKYVLKTNKINKFNKKLMLPYENHLEDIIEISSGQQVPSHTTPNSIRHVLETICKFENRDKSLERFVQENDILNENAYVYTLMQDLSHGRLRYQNLSDDELINSCKVVIDFIGAKYPGQLEGYNSIMVET